MDQKLTRPLIGVVYSDAEGNRRWPPLLVSRLPWTRRRVTIDPMVVGAAFTLTVVNVGVVAGIWWFWTVGITAFDVALMILMTVLVNNGITVGYHRFFSHRSFEAKPWVAAALGIWGAMSMQGPVLTWVSVHRRHHHLCDDDGDPHTPRPIGTGLKGAFEGFVRGYAAWILSGRLYTYSDYVRDLRKDPVIRWVDRWYWAWVVLGWVLPGLIGAAWYGSWTGFWSGFFAGGALRSFLHLNATGVVNTFGHLTGKRPFTTKDDSTNSVFVNLVALNGEGLHNNHHAIPWSARFSMFKGEIDPGFWIVKALEAMGLVWGLKVPTEKLVAARAVSAQPPLEETRPATRVV